MAKRRQQRLVTLTVTRPDPILTMSKLADKHVLSWQASLTGFRLQSATNLSQSTLWSDITTPPVFYQGRNVVTNDTSGSTLFYRLIK